jgi:membrane-associated phospholipid phosphatase
MSTIDRLKTPPDAQTGSRLRRIGGNIAQFLALITRAPRDRTSARWRGLHAAAVAGGLAVAIAVLMMFADVHTVAVASHLPAWLLGVLSELTDLGKSGWFLIPLGIALAFIAVCHSPALPRTAQLVLLAVTIRLSFLFAAIAVPSLFTSIVKRVIGRARPFVDLAGDPFHLQAFVWRPEYASMPSGHATTAVAAAMAFGMLWPQLRAPLWAYAVIILASRVLLAAHYPSDILAGAAVGTAGVLLVRDWFAARRLGFTIDANGCVVAWPAPSYTRIKRVARRLLAP